MNVMNLKKFFEDSLKCISDVLIQCYSWCKQQITITHQEQQLEYIYDLNFDNLPDAEGKIKEQFQWLDGIHNKGEFRQLKIKKDEQNDLDKFYNNVATIKEDSNKIKQYINGGIFFCLKDYEKQVAKKFKEFVGNQITYLDINKKNNHQNNIGNNIPNDIGNIIQNNNENNENNDENNIENIENQEQGFFDEYWQPKPEVKEVFNQIGAYAKQRFGKDNFRKCDLDNLFGKEFYPKNENELQLGEFITKLPSINTYQNIIMVNKIKPKNLNSLRDGQRIVEEIVYIFLIIVRRVERLLQQSFKLRSEHLHYTALSAKNNSNEMITQIKNQIQKTEGAIEMLIKYKEQIMNENDLVNLKNQMYEIKIIADQYKWEKEKQQIESQLDQENIDQFIQGTLEIIQLKLQNLQESYSQINLIELQTSLQDWLNLVKQTKTKWKFYHLFFFSNLSLIVNKKEFINIMQEII